MSSIKNANIDPAKKVMIRKIESRYGSIRLPSKYQKESEKKATDDIFSLDISSLGIETGNDNASVVC